VNRLRDDLLCLLACAVLLALPVLMVFIEPKSGGR